MLEAFINARDRFLKNGGLVMPSRGDIYAQPITDGQLWQEQEAKASFWRSQDFHGVDLSALHDAALDEYFGQAVVGYYPPEAAVSDDVATYAFDFGTCSVQDLRKFEIPFSFRITRTAILHGFGCWFDARFDGSTASSFEYIAKSPGHALVPVSTTIATADRRQPRPEHFRKLEICC